MIELVIQKIFLEKGKVDFMLNFEDYGKEKAKFRMESQFSMGF